MRELVRPFGFFVLVFTGVIWLTQSLRVIDTVVNSGKGAGIFLEFSGLLLPFVFSVVLPIAAFGAALYVTNRLYAESELAAALAGGASPTALARPYLVFGFLVALATALATTTLNPLANRQMRDRVAELRGDVAGALIFGGRFMNPAPGLTVYVRDNNEGRMDGVFVADRRDPLSPVVYSARQALLSETEAGPRLIMFDGAAQREEAAGGFSLLRFERLAFDLAQFMRVADDRTLKPSERTALELIAPTAEALARDERGKLYAEGHEQLSSPFYALALPLVALAAILAGGYSRRGYGGRVVFAAALGMGLRLAGLGAKTATVANAALWPLLYAPPLIGAAIAYWSLTRSGNRGGGRR